MCRGARGFLFPDWMIGIYTRGECGIPKETDLLLYLNYIYDKFTETIDAYV